MSATTSTVTPGPGAGPLQRLIAPLVEPAIYDFWVGMVNPAWSWSRALAKVVERRVEAQDAVTLVLKPNAHCGKVRPGQHVNVSAEVNGRRTTRSYSITNVPGKNGLLEITVKRVEGGKLSTHLCRDLRAGDVVELGTVFGEMTLPAQAKGKWLFLAAGSGITPLMSLTRQQALQGMPLDLLLVYWAKTRAELCFVPELRALAARHPNFKLQIVLTHEAQTLADEASGLISAPQLAELVHDLSERQIYACGPGGFVDAARSLTKDVARGFLAEGFTPSAPAMTADQTAEPTTVRVQLRKSGRALDLSSGTSLLVALEEAGMSPAAGCRIGICRTCVCTKHEGTTQDITTGDQDTEPDTQVRLCVSRALTDLSLDI
ncbi:ferredoxin reductase [Aquabacterium sp.]|uniref:ferredoxin reductase n=1 Tax=Aquabacterium sp. TaxID=1872578 RepID=UPI0025C0CDB5|nr:ferredoxin reductase [Aquabacterium sp.]